MAVCPAKTEISLGIRLVWSEFSLSAWRKLGFLATHWTLSEDSDQTGQMPRLIILIRLGRCPGWSESSLGTHSFCWFCHVVAQLWTKLFTARIDCVWWMQDQITDCGSWWLVTVNMINRAFIIYTKNWLCQSTDCWLCWLLMVDGCRRINVWSTAKSYETQCLTTVS